MAVWVIDFGKVGCENEVIRSVHVEQRKAVLEVGLFSHLIGPSAYICINNVPVTTQKGSNLIEFLDVTRLKNCGYRADG